jgi:hypothetical protein
MKKSSLKQTNLLGFVNFSTDNKFKDTDMTDESQQEEEETKTAPPIRINVKKLRAQLFK